MIGEREAHLESSTASKNVEKSPDDFIIEERSDGVVFISSSMEESTRFNDSSRRESDNSFF